MKIHPSNQPRPPDYSRPPQNGAEASELQLWQLVDAVQSLLHVHEVGLAIGLLKHICDCELGKAMLPFSQEQLQVSISSFMAQVKKDPCGDGLRALSASIGANADRMHPTQRQSKSTEPKFDSSHDVICLPELPCDSPIDSRLPSHEEFLRAPSPHDHNPKASPKVFFNFEEQPESGPPLPPTVPPPVWGGTSICHDSAPQEERKTDGVEGRRTARSTYFPRFLLKMQESRAALRSTTTSKMAMDDDSESDEETPISSTLSLGQEMDWNAICEENAYRLGKPTHACIIHPNHVGRTLWDFASFLWIVIESVTIPFSFCFDADTSEAWYLAGTIFFSIDMVLSSLTGFYIEGVLIMRQQLILQAYMKGFLVVDFISAFPWELVLSVDAGDSHALRMARILRLVRLLRLMKLRDLLWRLEELLPHTSIAFSFLNTLGLFMMLCHWSACVWGLLGNPAKIEHRSSSASPHELSGCEPAGPCEPGIFGSPWIHRYGLDNDNFSVEDKYLASLHFATGIMTGNDVGMDASHWPERIFVIVMMVISFLVCSTVVSEIVVMIHKVTEDSAEFKERLRKMKSFFMKKKVPIAVQQKIIKYFEFQYKMKQSGLTDRQAFFEHLSPWLKLELTATLNGDIIKRHPFFQKMNHKVFKRVCAICNSMLCGSGDVIFQRGRSATFMCFIVQGKLLVQQVGHASEMAKSSDRDSDVLQEEDEPIILESPAFCGDACLFKDKVRSNTVIAITHTELLTVDKKDLQSLMLEFPKIKTKYDAWTNNYESKLGSDLICESCGQLGHLRENCKANTWTAKNQSVSYTMSLAKMFREERNKAEQKKSRLTQKSRRMDSTSSTSTSTFTK